MGSGRPVNLIATANHRARVRDPTTELLLGPLGVRAAHPGNRSQVTPAQLGPLIRPAPIRVAARRQFQRQRLTPRPLERQGGSGRCSYGPVMPTFSLAVPAQRSGALEVWRAANTARGNAPAPRRVARVKAKLADPAALLVVGCDGDTVIAMAVAEPARQDCGAGLILPCAGHVSMVFVAPERWGVGVGTQLMEALHLQMRARGWDTASLWTRTSNQPARRLYAGRGYRLTADVKALDGGDEIVRYELTRRLHPARS